MAGLAHHGAHIAFECPELVNDAVDNGNECCELLSTENGWPRVATQYAGGACLVMQDLLQLVDTRVNVADLHIKVTEFGSLHIQALTDGLG